MLRRENDFMCNAIRCAPQKLSRLFYSKHLISTEIHRLSTDGTVDTDTAVQRTVDALKSKVQIYPAAYHSIVDVFKQVSVTERVADYLEKWEISERETIRKMAEKKNRKLVEAQSKLHNLDASNVRRQYSFNDNQFGSAEATDPMTCTTETRNITPHKGARSGPVEYDLTMPFRHQNSPLMSSPERGYSALPLDNSLASFSDNK